MSEDAELKRGSDNIFRDLGFPDSDAQLMKADLAAAIVAVLNKRKLTARAAGKVAGVAHTDIVNIRNVKLGRFSIERLVRILNALDQRVELRISNGAHLVRARKIRGELKGKKFRVADIERAINQKRM